MKRRQENGSCIAAFFSSSITQVGRPAVGALGRNRRDLPEVCFRYATFQSCLIQKMRDTGISQARLATALWLPEQGNIVGVAQHQTGGPGALLIWIWQPSF